MTVTINPSSIGEWVVVTVIFRYMFLPWVGKQLARLFKFIFLRTEHEVAIWLHYKEKVAVVNMVEAEKGIEEVKKA